MAKRVLRKFEAYAMHAHHDAASTYVDLFEKLEALPRADRLFEIASTTIAFPIVEKSDGKIFIQAVEGGDSSALILNTTTGRTRENILGESELLSEASHMLVSPTKRRAAIEFVRRGPKAAVVAVAIEGLLREHYPELHDLRFEFTPVVGENFISEIRSFERIRIAKIRMARPNASWTEHYTELSDFMEESGGDKVEVGVRAAEGKSLKKNGGVMKAIREVVGDAQPYLDDASVTGTREGETAETTIRARKHVVHTKANVDTDDAGVASAHDIRVKLGRFLGIL